MTCNKSKIWTLVCSSLFFLSLSCKHTSPSNLKIIQGEPLPPEHPLRLSTVGLGVLNDEIVEIFCSGTLIELKEDKASNSVTGKVMTAAHCIPEGEDFYVAFGDKPSQTRDLAKVSSVRKYNYDGRSFGSYMWRYDFATVDFTSPMRHDLTPVPLDDGIIEDKQEFDSLAVGYGLFETNISGERLHASLTAKVRTEGLFRDQIFVTSDSGQSPCHGDSGGGLFRKDSSGWRLAGVAQGYDAISRGSSGAGHSVTERCQKSKLRYSLIQSAMPWLAEEKPPVSNNDLTLDDKNLSGDTPENLVKWCSERHLSPKHESVFMYVVGHLAKQYIEQLEGSWSEEHEQLAQNNPIDFPNASCTDLHSWIRNIKMYDVSFHPLLDKKEFTLADPVFRSLISQFTGLEKLSISFIANPNEIPKLSQIKSLGISYSSLSSRDMASIAGQLPELEKLYVSSMKITDTNFISEFKKLNFLGCNVCKIPARNRYCPLAQDLTNGLGCYFGEPLSSQREILANCLNEDLVTKDENWEFCQPLAGSEIATGDLEQGKSIFKAYKSAKKKLCEEKYSALSNNVLREDYSRRCFEEETQQASWLEQYYLQEI